MARKAAEPRDELTVGARQGERFDLLIELLTPAVAGPGGISDGATSSHV
jgi:hypothetical protein